MTLLKLKLSVRDIHLTHGFSDSTNCLTTILSFQSEREIIFTDFSLARPCVVANCLSSRVANQTKGRSQAEHVLLVTCFVSIINCK